MADGHLQPDYPIADINQKGVYRRDLGDLDALADSLDRLGLLTPIVVTTDGDLICGKRRLAAAKKLGWTTVSCWVPDKVSPTLRMVALFDDENLRKSLTPIEQANLYGEYEQLYAQQARLRQEATRFQPGNTAAVKTDEEVDAGASGSDSPEAATSHKGKAKRHAAQAVTGSSSQTRLDQIRELQAIATDDRQHPSVQQDAVEALVELNADGKVNPRWQRVKLNQQMTALDRAAINPAEPADVRSAAAQAAADIRGLDDPVEAIRHGKQALAELDRLRADAPPPPAKPVDAHAAEKREARLLGDLIRREHGYWQRGNPQVFGPFAEPAAWELALAYRIGVDEFMDAATAARAAAGL
ncbi:MAG: ParB N-terminal domain-containing protein [Propionibacteriaceae bacterium]|nr:ParB N-terminal domain-containing protein [Propionibacteriaceae bacterium]